MHCMMRGLTPGRVLAEFPGPAPSGFIQARVLFVSNV